MPVWKQRSAAAFAVCLLVFSAAATCPSQTRQPQRRPPARGARAEGRDPGPPRLVVVITVDQFRYDFLDRFGDLFGKGGFNRLRREGALMTSAHYNYVPTYTAPGHASIFTGSVPAMNGIVGNTYFDRASGRVREMVSDGEARAVTSAGVAAEKGSFSPRVLYGTTIGDQMRLANNFQSKVVALSYKDRSAILPGGKRPNGAYWYSSQTGTFVSSDYYFSQLPAWVLRFNESQRPERFFNQTWDRALPTEAYRRVPGDHVGVQQSALGAGFPYTVNGGEEKAGPEFYHAFEYAPFANEHLLAFARAAIEAEGLGADAYPDLLSISFSNPDLVGHAYGPDSPEVLDTYVRLDRMIEGFLGYLDERVGLANVVIVVSADHGVAPVPEVMQRRGFEARRIPARALADAANQALEARFGAGKWVLAGPVNDQFYLDRRLLAEKRVDAGEAERVAGEALLAVPGVVNYFTREQILEGRVPDGPVGRRVVNGFHRERSGDVWFVTAPFCFVADETLAATHGSPYNYDTHVPIIFFGAGIARGVYDEECAPADIAPTLCALLGVEMPTNRTGRVLPVLARKQTTRKSGEWGVGSGE